MSIKVFVFDMGDVVIQERHVWGDVLKQFGIAAKNIRDLGPNSTQAVLQMLVSDMSEESFWELVQQDTNQAMQWEGILSSCYSCNPIQGTIKIIQTLIAQGKRVVCGTNNIRPFYEQIKEAGYYDIFPKVYSSFMMGISKPNPDFFRYIAEEEGVELNEIFFTDDNAQNIGSAAKLGIITHQFTDAVSLQRRLEELEVGENCHV